MITVYVELVCDGCARTTAGTHATGGRYPHRKMVAQAKREGWAFPPHHTLCGRCSHDDTPEDANAAIWVEAATQNPFPGIAAVLERNAAAPATPQPEDAP